MCDLQTANCQEKNYLVIKGLVADKFLLYIVNKHQCNMFIMCSVFNKLLTVTGNNNISTVKIGLVTEIFIPNYQSLFFKLTQLA